MRRNLCDAYEINLKIYVKMAESLDVEFNLRTEMCDSLTFKLAFIFSWSKRLF